MVECSIGILKSKFPCLRYLRLKSPQKCCLVILACITLHNLEITNQRRKVNSFENVYINAGYIEQSFTTADDVIAEIVAQFEAE